MALMPKRVKHRKSQRGRIKGNATRGNRVVFGDYGLQAMQGGWISAQTIEAEDQKVIASGQTSFCDEHTMQTPGNGTRIVTATRLTVISGCK